MSYRVATDTRFKRRYRKKSPERRAAVRKCIELLTAGPFERRGSLQTKPLQVVDGQRVFYARIDRSHRVTFHIDGDLIVLRNNCHEEDVLRSP